jgi:hypothetical protein
MLGITESHFEAISNYVAGMNTNIIKVGSVIKIKDNYSKAMKFVVVAVAGDTLKVVWKTTMTNKNAFVSKDSVQKVLRHNALDLNETCIVSASWKAIA